MKYHVVKYCGLFSSKSTYSAKLLIETIVVEVFRFVLKNHFGGRLANETSLSRHSGKGLGHSARRYFYEDTTDFLGYVPTPRIN